MTDRQPMVQFGDEGLLTFSPEAQKYVRSARVMGVLPVADLIGEHAHKADDAEHWSQIDPADASEAAVIVRGLVRRAVSEEDPDVTHQLLAELAGLPRVPKGMAHFQTLGAAARAAYDNLSGFDLASRALGQTQRL